MFSAMKISGIDFPRPLLTAMRNHELVVFAGAGVSMGEPAHLPSFKALATAIAQDTGNALHDHEPEDPFLGRLKHNGTNVHAIAAEKLKMNSRQQPPQPTDLHRNLLRLYQELGSVRIVTTNFDTLFEDAAKDVFDSTPEVFRAPALPLGRAFNGIVHVHGALDCPDAMVLTDADFGRAYLIEGWARHFLVELFRTFTVLFVGYSHDDIVMRYLARALQESETGNRFALTEEATDDRWTILGIKAIAYQRAPDDDHANLHKGITGLAKYTRYGAFDWKQEITKLAKKPPSALNREETDLIHEEALSDATKTYFFTDASSLPEWIAWLDTRGHLDRLFESGNLPGEQDRLLAQWLAKRFAFTHSYELFRLIAKHGTRLNSTFWYVLSRTIGSQTDQQPDVDVLARWVSLLLATAPATSVDHLTLYELGKRCAASGLTDSLVDVFDAMIADRLTLSTLPDWSLDDEQDAARHVEFFPPTVRELPQTAQQHQCHWTRHLWQEALKPRLDEHTTKTLLRRVVDRLTMRHRTLRAWQKAHCSYDQESYRRSAIEPHEQNQFDKPVDVLIDAARDCLEWLASNRQETATRWCDELAAENAPLLRRLAVHALSTRRDLTPDKKADWLLDRIGLHDPPIHHEIFRTMHTIYPSISSTRREAIIAAVSAYRSPDDENQERRTARRHFEWFHWLHDADPNCHLAKEALDDVRNQYPDWRPSEHPDLTHWSHGVRVGSQSPWTADHLLSRPADTWLEELLSFQPPDPLADFLGPNRDGLCDAVKEAARKDLTWGRDLADALITCAKWNTDLWGALLSAWAWRDAPLNDSQYRAVLQRLQTPELQKAHAGLMTMFLYTQGARDPLAQANELAVELWNHLDRSEHTTHQLDDWERLAINHPAGNLAQFWLNSLSLWRSRQNSAPSILNDEYCSALSTIVNDTSVAGRFGRCILARGFARLLEADAQWTMQYLRPLFDTSDEDEYIAVWSGFLWGNINIPTFEIMQHAMLQAASRILQTDFPNSQLFEKFVEVYAQTTFFFVDDPLQEWIPRFFMHAGEDRRREFTQRIAFYLYDINRFLNETQQREIWERWLRPYWKRRLDGVYAPISDRDEIERMLSWLPQLKAVFPEAVDLAVRMPKTQIRSGHFLWEIRKNSLWKIHPQAVAKLLIYLGTCDYKGSLAADAKELIENLLQSDLPRDIEHNLRDLQAQLGLS